MGTKKYSQQDFEDLAIDILGIRPSEWNEIKDLCWDLVDQKIFDGDPLKCCVTAISLLISNGRFLQEEDCLGDPVNDWMN